LVRQSFAALFVLGEPSRPYFDEIWNDLSLELPAAKTALRETIRRQLEFDPQLGGGELSLSNSAPLEEN